MLTVKLIKPWANKPVGELCRLMDATAQSLIDCGQAELVLKPKKSKPVSVAKPASGIFGKKPATDKDDG